MSIELYLIRHGLATDKETAENDETRPLTKKGRKKTRKVAKQLSDRQLHFDLILTSPLLRAKETATILQDIGLCSVTEEISSLAPRGNIQDWVSWLQTWQQNHPGDRCLALVGHQPDLGNWAEILVWGNAQEKLLLKKSGVIGIKLPETETPIGRSHLFLMTSPKWLL